MSVSQSGGKWVEMKILPAEEEIKILGVWRGISKGVADGLKAIPLWVGHP
jgi:hypothetical protein